VPRGDVHNTKAGIRDRDRWRQQQHLAVSAQHLQNSGTKAEHTEEARRRYREKGVCRPNRRQQLGFGLPDGRQGAVWGGVACIHGRQRGIGAAPWARPGAQCAATPVAIPRASRGRKGNSLPRLTRGPQVAVRVRRGRRLGGLGWPVKQAELGRAVKSRVKPDALELG
jgi:hypothetical protein